MKEYICLNHINCAWADEKPPRKFTLANADEPCPECGKFNVKEVKTKSSSPWGIALLLLTGLIIIMLMFKYWPETVGPKKTGGSETSDTTSQTSPEQKGTTVKKDSVNGPTIPPRPAENHPQPIRTAVVWTRVPDSDFCISDCVVEYTEQDNLGHTRKRTVANYTKCCPATK